MPLVTYYVYTKAHANAVVPRKQIYAAWHSVHGQPDETQVHKQANVEPPDMIAKGHCQAWIIAYEVDGAILFDTYTFNAGIEYQGQNVGTEIATEELCRKLANQTDSVRN